MAKRAIFLSVFRTFAIGNLKSSKDNAHSPYIHNFTFCCLQGCPRGGA